MEWTNQFRILWLEFISLGGPPIDHDRWNNDLTIHRYSEVFGRKWCLCQLATPLFLWLKSWQNILFWAFWAFSLLRDNLADLCYWLIEFLFASKRHNANGQLGDWLFSTSFCLHTLCTVVSIEYDEDSDIYSWSPLSLALTLIGFLKQKYLNQRQNVHLFPTTRSCHCFPHQRPLFLHIGTGYLPIHSQSHLPLNLAYYGIDKWV